MEKKIKPFLKWPGRKYNIISNIKVHLPLPDRYTTLVEPFVGSAAIFLNTSYKNYQLSDSNPDLINTYKYLVKDGEKFVKYSAKLFVPENNNQNKYYELRERFNYVNFNREKAALFIYLNRHGYNGLCRYNGSGIYNVPFGSYKQVYYPSIEMLQFHEKSMAVNLSLQCEDFTQCLTNVKSESVVYCDPPYMPISKTSYFTKYSKNDFNFEHQLKLVELIRELKNYGTAGFISNHDISETRKLYYDAQIISFPVKRMISCQAHGRKYVKELLAIYQQQ